MPGTSASRPVITAVAFFGAAPVLYLHAPTGSGLWLASLHLAVGVLLLTRRFWGRWLVMGVAGGDFLLGMVHALEFDGVRRALLIMALLSWSAAITRLNYGARVARSYDGQGAWTHRHGLASATVDGIKRSFLGIGLALPFLAELIGQRLPEARRPELAWSALALIMLGGFGLLRQRTWSMSALSTAAALVAAFALSARGAQVSMLGAFAALGLGLAVSPFLIPIYRAFRGASRSP